MSDEPGSGFRFVRLYADERGETHFEDVVVAAEAQGHVSVTQPIPLSSMIMRRVAPTDAEAVRHNAPRRQFIVHLEGSVEVEASDGERRRFDPGDVVLVEDVAGQGHVTRRLEGGEHRTLFLPVPD